MCAWAALLVFYLSAAAPIRQFEPCSREIEWTFRWMAEAQKCPTGNKSTLEPACLTRFQPRLSCLFIVIGLTMSLRCGFEWSRGSRSPVIVRRYSARDSVCVGMIRHVYRLTVDSPLSIHNCLATERLLNRRCRLLFCCWFWMDSVKNVGIWTLKCDC